jgi:hypothetical protein
MESILQISPQNFFQRFTPFSNDRLTISYLNIEKKLKKNSQQVLRVTLMRKMAFLTPKASL